MVNVCTLDHVAALQMSGSDTPANNDVEAAIFLVESADTFADKGFPALMWQKTIAEEIQRAILILERA